jgi:hypothetical protein
VKSTVSPHSTSTVTPNEKFKKAAGAEEMLLKVVFALSLVSLSYSWRIFLLCFLQFQLSGIR